MTTKTMGRRKRHLALRAAEAAAGLVGGLWIAWTLLPEAGRRQVATKASAASAAVRAVLAAWLEAAAWALRGLGRQAR
jgi:hypothetical protein